MTNDHPAVTNALARCCHLVFGRWLPVFALLALSASLAAQGTIAGALKDQAGTTTWFDDPPTVGAIVLPDESHPFNEITAATWQQAMTALAEGREVETPFGSLDRRVAPESTVLVVADADGSFLLNDLPLERRIGVAARVGDTWWPVAREFWLTENQPSAQTEVPFFTMDADLQPAATRHELSARLMLRPDLKYAGITLLETLSFQNESTTHAAMVEVRLELALPPGILARHLPSLYGSQLIFMQGTDGLPTFRGDSSQPLARQAWLFGGGDVMHGGGAVYGKGPQRSADNWHPLNEDTLHMIGAGDTLYQDQASPSGRSAALIFRRPIPPARDGVPGTLQIALLHAGGVPLDAPDTKLALTRGFPVDLRNARANVDARLTLSALLPQEHRSLYGDPVTEAGMVQRESTHSPAIPFGEEAQLVFGLSEAAKAELAAVAAPPEAPRQAAPDSEGVRWHVIFIALAIVFGIAFLGALVASVRLSRDKQLERLKELPSTRAGLISALAALEADYKAGRMPAAPYLEQRQRLISRLIEHDVKG